MCFDMSSYLPILSDTVTLCHVASTCEHLLIKAPLAYSESVSIPKNPRTDRPVGYAFVDLSTPTEAERAIAELSGKEILERKVSVQLARKPEAAGEKTEGANGEHGEGTRRRQSTRGRGRAGRGRSGRARGGRTGSGVSRLTNNHIACYGCSTSADKGT